MSSLSAKAQEQLKVARNAELVEEVDNEVANDVNALAKSRTRKSKSKSRKSKSRKSKTRKTSKRRTGSKRRTSKKRSAVRHVKKHRHISSAERARRRSRINKMPRDSKGRLMKKH